MHVWAVFVREIDEYGLLKLFLKIKNHEVVYSYIEIFSVIHDFPVNLEYCAALSYLKISSCSQIINFEILITA